jgi:cobalamin-dependent methionine synthase I
MEEEKTRSGATRRAQGKIVMATVKGDVTTSARTSSASVLGCNNYEVLDLGVMVPAAKILQTAIDEQADLIGLSGLITPSLDEMVFVAREMERRGMKLPLLIGGATTSKPQQAVKIAPEYGQPTVHVLDASRAVDVVASLLNPAQRPAFVRANQAEQERVRQQYGAVRRRPLLTWDAAKANRLRLDWRPEVIATPSFTGARVLDDVRLEDVVPFIDWTFFFSAWELKGRFPRRPGSPAIRHRRTRALRPCANAVSAHCRPAAAHAARRSMGSGKPTRLAKTSFFRIPNPGSRIPRSSTCSGNRKRSATTGRIDRSPISSRRLKAGSRITSARLR